MKKAVKFTCPLDCFDACALVAAVEDGRVVSIRGDKDHPVTDGFCCRKGLRHLERLYHPERLRTPLKKSGRDWIPVSWDEALDRIAGELGSCIRQHGSASILHYAASGYGGLIKRVDDVFFNTLGGASVPRGSLCWGAGMAAQTYDFGAVRGHHPRDMAKARTILVWGRNPMDTNIHLVPHLRRARRNGARVFLIDPRVSASTELADRHLAVRPATDGALALGIAHVILQNNWHDRHFLRNRTLGFDAYRRQLDDFPPERVAHITGIPREDIEAVARAYGLHKPAAVILGYGLQRYANGGNTVRCIDALGAITGNIGTSGGGVNYANRTFPPYIAGELAKSQSLARNRRTFPVARLAEFIETADAPPIDCLFVLKANPLVQSPHLHKTLTAFQKVPFKTAVDMFMTDTARHCDLVLPCTSVLEEEDVIYSSMFSPYLHFSEKAVEPPVGVMSEFDLFRTLAERMGLDLYPRHSRRRFLQEAIRPLTGSFGIDIGALRQRTYFRLPGGDVPWKNAVFETPSGKYEFFSERARSDGLSPLPVFIPPPPPDPDYPLRLLTPHWKQSLHSQHFAFIDTRPTAYLHPQTLTGTNTLQEGAAAVLVSPRGRLTATVRTDPGLPEDAVLIYQGWWHKSGAVNFLTDDRLSDMGEQAAYYDCFCRIEPVG
jgi:anaerobic selenocysteine-containing dehydrogenase